MGFPLGGGLEVVVPRGMPPRKVEKFLYAHQRRILKHHANQVATLTPDLAADSREHYLAHKEQALARCTERVEHWNQFCQYDYNTIRVKRMKTRWGSCSSKKNLNFNYKILFLPEERANYIIVHELCHLAEMNHGPRFWALV